MNRKEEILTAALPVFVRYGYKRATMDDVADAAELSRQSLYNVFKSKSELFAAFIAFHTERGLQAVSDALAAAGPADERFVNACESWFGPQVDAVRASPHGVALTKELCEAAGDRLTESKNEVISRFARALGHADAHETQLAALTIYATCKGLATMSTDRAEFRQRVEASIPLLLGGYASLNKLP